MSFNPIGLPGSLSFNSVVGTGRGVLTWNTTGVAAGLYALPVQAAANGRQAQASTAVKIVPDNLYWRWAEDKLSPLADLAKTEPNADSDGDGVANVFEMALMPNP